MNTRKNIIITLFIGALVTLFTSCENDDTSTAKPVISDLEIGLDDSHVAYIGADLHLEAEIVAEGKISTISVELHQEEGDEEEIEVVYDEFEGLRNTTFHKHIDIPSTSTAGTYHCHITVTDMEGYQTTVEDEIEIEALEDTIAPVFTMTSTPVEGITYYNGESISIAGSVTDNTALAGMVVALVYTDDNISDEDVAGDNSSVIVMLHTHTFDNEATHSFSPMITVGAAMDNNMTPAAISGDNAWKTGSYYILIKCKDANGNWAYSDQYPITIN